MAASGPEIAQVTTNSSSHCRDFALYVRVLSAASSGAVTWRGRGPASGWSQAANA